MARENNDFSRLPYWLPTMVALYLTLISTLVFNQYALSIFGATMLTPVLPIWGAALIVGLAVSLVTAVVSAGLFMRRLRDSHRFLDASLLHDEPAKTGKCSNDFKCEAEPKPAAKLGESAQLQAASRAKSLPVDLDKFDASLVHGKN